MSMHTNMSMHVAKNGGRRPSRTRPRPRSPRRRSKEEAACEFTVIRRHVYVHRKERALDDEWLRPFLLLTELIFAGETPPVLKMGDVAPLPKDLERTRARGATLFVHHVERDDRDDLAGLAQPCQLVTRRVDRVDRAAPRQIDPFEAARAQIAQPHVDSLRVRDRQVEQVVHVDQE